MAGKLIGKGGTTIKRIRETSGARVILHDIEEGKDTRTIGITGSEGQVQLAISMVQEAFLEATMPQHSPQAAGFAPPPPGYTDATGMAAFHAAQYPTGTSGQPLYAPPLPPPSFGAIDAADGEPGYAPPHSYLQTPQGLIAVVDGSAQQQQQYMVPPAPPPATCS